MIVCLMISTPIATQANLINWYMDLKKLTNQLKIHEGYKTKVYLDTTGHRTIGFGFNLERSDAEVLLRSVGANYQDVIDGKYEISREQAEKLLQHDLDRLEADAKKLVFVYDDLDDVRQRVILDMLFNLGTYGFSRFKNTIKHICNGNYEQASQNMLHSLWAKQTHGRAKNLARMMRSGEDVYDL